jgi:hypothetical protein
VYTAPIAASPRYCPPSSIMCRSGI